MSTLLPSALPTPPPPTTGSRKMGLLAVRISSFLGGFAAMGGFALYSLRSDIWASHRQLESQVREGWPRRPTPISPPRGCTYGPVPGWVWRSIFSPRVPLDQH